MKRNAYIDGMMGLVVGDALGVPYEFRSREQMKAEPAADMVGYGTYNVPVGTWSDDSSMALATLDALRKVCDLEAIMRNFSDWLYNRKYTPYGEVFDIGLTCRTAISNYVKSGNINNCGCGGEYENGNGSLMRILPACIYFCNEEVSGRSSVNEIIKNIHAVSALTHSHLRSMIACGLYYFLVKEMIVGSGSISERLQRGFNNGFAFYEADPANLKEISGTLLCQNNPIYLLVIAVLAVLVGLAANMFVNGAVIGGIVVGAILGIRWFLERTLVLEISFQGDRIGIMLKGYSYDTADKFHKSLRAYLAQIKNV